MNNAAARKRGVAFNPSDRRQPGGTPQGGPMELARQRSAALAKQNATAAQPRGADEVVDSGIARPRMSRLPVTPK